MFDSPPDVVCNEVSRVHVKVRIIIMAAGVISRIAMMMAVLGMVTVVGVLALLAVGVVLIIRKL